MASEKGFTGIVSALLEGGADVNGCNNVRKLCDIGTNLINVNII